MWCPACQQHVAAIVGDSGDGALCASCGAEIDVFADLATVGAAPARRRSESPRDAVLPHLSSSRARLDHIGRRLEALTLHGPPTSQRRPAPATPIPQPRSRPYPAWVAAAGLFGGTTALVCGVSLAAWSLVSDRGELWNIGLPTALVGQFLLLAALAAQCDFWRSAPPTAVNGNR